MLQSRGLSPYASLLSHASNSYLRVRPPTEIFYLVRRGFVVYA